MNWILALPLELRLALLFVLGACAGSLVNLGVYRLAWHPRPISPWSRLGLQTPPRRWHHRVPIFGWLGLRREAAIHGLGFWIRPMLVELVCGAGLAGLYWWEIGRAGLLLPGVLPPGPAVLHAQYACHVVLMGLMLAGSLIDVDEKIIPDTITVPGTWLGLLAAAVLPWSLLPDRLRLAPFGLLGDPFAMGPSPQYHFLHLASPNPWPGWLGGFPGLWPLAIGLACWWAWCFALTPRTWYARHGWGRALGLCLARLRREVSTWRMLLGLLAGTAATVVVWLVGGENWRGLLSALVGMAAGGGIVWAIRIVGSAVLRREAMGFGDVTLMAMIGSFLGWQPCLMIFFLAPFAGVLIGLLGLVLRRGPEIPYGPFLCLAALVVIVAWAPLWERTAPSFSLGGYLVLVIFLCLILMVPLLFVIRLIRQALSGPGSAE